MSGVLDDLADLAGPRLGSWDGFGGGRDYQFKRPQEKARLALCAVTYAEVMALGGDGRAIAAVAVKRGLSSRTVRRRIANHKRWSAAAARARTAAP